MSFRSLGFQRCAAAFAAILLVSACTEDGRQAPLSGVEAIDIPVADVDNQNNQNISNPTLTIPQTFKVADGDLLTLVWSDEFNGAQLDPEVWFYESGDGTQYGIPFPAWGNNELQYYLPDNVQVANGTLQITARREAAEGYSFTSGRVTTRDRVAFKYGRIEASIKLPSGQGLWPAFWMLPQDDEVGTAPGKGLYGVYAQSGEIDIVEAINLDANPTPAGRGGDNEIFSTIHFGGDSSVNQNLSSETIYTPSFDVTADFHTYAFEWDEFEMRWYADGTLYKVENFWSSAGGAYPAPFDQPFYVLFNLAVGGSFPGSPDGTTPNPATLEVDWIRVYSGEDNYVPADPGTVPDVVLYATDPNETVDLVFGVDYAGFDPFGSGSSFNNDNTSDRDFSPAFGVTTGNGYGAQVGQLGIFGFDAGFATGYSTLDFKAKNLNNDLIRVKFNPAGGYLDVDLTTSGYSTALGNGWYQVSIPIADFTGVDTATTLLFETDNTAPAAFTFLLTDLGFSGSTGGGGTGITPEFVVYATDPGLTEDLAPPGGIQDFGSGAAFNLAFAGDADFNPALQVTSGTGYGADAGFAAFTGYTAGFATSYETLLFKVKGDAGNLSQFEVKFFAPDDTNTYDLTTYSGSTDLGNGWYQVSIPMTDFDAGNLATSDGFLMGPLGAQAGPFSFLMTDIGFSGGGGGGAPGITPEAVVYATDPGLTEDLAPPGGIQDFGSGAAFNPAFAGDADFNPALQVTSGTGYGSDAGFAAFTGYTAGFAAGYETLLFKAKGDAANLGQFEAKFFGPDDSQVYDLTTYSGSTDIGNGWYQVSIPLSDFNATNIGGYDGFLLGPLGAQAAPFSYLLTDIGFSGTNTGGGDTCVRPAAGPGVDLATNGDVESGDLTCWSLFDNGGTIAVSSPGAGGSGFAVNVDASGQAIGVTLKQANLGAGELTPGQTVRLSFDWRGTAALGGVVDIVLFSEVDGGGVSQTDPIQGGGVFPADWTTVGPLDITIGPDVSAGVTLQITAICGGDAGCESNLFIDNVSIVTP